ncbi:MAG TPA: hypothetical protein VFE62_08425 [Gemmataceae bacterium]|nr:hypothetical protein [Gemmataceae bacterium]
MTEDRFSQPTPEQPVPTSGFVIMPVGEAPQSASPMQWLYQQLYAQAQQANQRPAPRDLFAVMN